MRSFSKKLAFVLAAAMVVTAFAPAASAKAADEMAINKSEQILYVNEGINHKGGEVAAPGKGNVSVYDFNLKNKPADWKTAYSFAWSSSDEDVVSVAKGGVATAVGVGKATVYCKVTEKATKEVTTLKTKVTVKANAYEVEITNADKWDGATVEVNGVVDLNRAMYDEDGNKTTKRGTLVTDYTKWVAEPATGVEINQSNGKFTFTEAAEAGEYKLYCYTYQSSKYTEKTAESDAIVVEFVKDKTFEVVQNSTKKFTVTFSQKVDSLAVADVTVNRMVNDYAYAQVVKSATLAEDGMSATVEVFNSFADATNYTVKVKDFKETSFVASVGTPVRMEIVAVDKNPAYILTTNAQAVLKCLFYDAKGVDVTDAANYEASVTYKSETAASTAFTLYANKLTIKKNAASVVVVANYRGKFENGQLVGALEAKQEFIAQDTPAIYPTGVKAIELDGNWDNGNSKTTLQLAEKTQELYLQLNLSNSKDEKFDLGAANAAPFNLNNNGANERITVTAITPDVADIVNGVVIPHKAGTAVFYVNYGLKTNNNWNDVPFATVEIQVFEDAKLASIAIATPNFIVSTVDTYTVDDAEKDAAGKPVLDASGNVVATGVTAEYSSNEYLYEEMAGLELWRFYGNLIKKSVGTSKNSNNILGYDQRGNRINLNKTTDNVSIKCLTTNSTAGFSADAIVAWPYISTFYDTKYWADNNDYIGITTDGAALKTYLVNCGIFNEADDGEYFTLDYEVTYNNNGTNLKAYFTVTVAEPTSGQNGVDVKPSSSYVDIERYTTNDGNNNTENAKTLAFDVFEVNNGVTVGTLNKLVKFDATKKATSPYQFKVLKDGQDITNQAYITIGETSDYPYNQAGALVDDNKVIIALSGNKSDARLDKAINATGSAIVNYYANGGVGSYTFELYKWESADAVDPTLLVQTGATVVLGDNGTYTIDVNAQKSNTVVLSAAVGGVDSYSSVDAEKIVKCFSLKDRAGNSIFDNNGNVKSNYKYYVDYSAPANASNVYVKEIVFYEALTDGDYALYTVTVDTILQK